MIPRTVVSGVEEQLQSKIISTQRVGGGCINDAAIITTSRGEFFLKWNRAEAYPGMFEAEANGLNLLRATDTVHVPKPYFTGSAEHWSWIVMQALISGDRKTGFWDALGQSLAALHLQTAAQYGLDHNNYIGSLPQRNDQRRTWTGFFVEMRLEPQLKLAMDTRKLNRSVVASFEALSNELQDIFPDEPPALLHGDLWSGNYLTGPDGEAWLVDPAVYYGHREMDLAMTRLFGGFDEAFYSAYNQAFTLKNGWEERVEICNLYPLLVHVNLFGGGYATTVEAILRRFQ